MNIKTLFEKAAPGIVAAAVIAGGTATYQFAQMRIEIEVLKAGQVRVEAKVDALIARQAYWRGPDETATVKRMAAGIPDGVPGASYTHGVAFASEKP